MSSTAVAALSLEDGFRLQQLVKATAAEGHPERHFGCGNRQTLLAQGPLLGLCGAA